MRNKKRILTYMLLTLILLSACRQTYTILFEAYCMITPISMHADTDKLIRLTSEEQTKSFYSANKGCFVDSDDRLWQTLSRFDAAFFQTRLLLVYIKTESSISISHEVRSVTVDHGKLVARVRRVVAKNYMEPMVGYDCILIAIENKYAKYECGVEFD